MNWLNMKNLLFLFLSLSFMFFLGCSNTKKNKLNHAFNEYDKKIDSFGVLLNTFTDPNPDSVILKIKNLENEYTDLIVTSNNRINNLMKDLKTITISRKNLKIRYLNLQMKANLMLQKIIQTKSKKMISRLQEAKQNLNQTVENFNLFGNDVLNEIQKMNKAQNIEIDQTIQEIEEKEKIQLDSLNRQFLELRAMMKNK